MNVPLAPLATEAAKEFAPTKGRSKAPVDQVFSIGSGNAENVPRTFLIFGDISTLGVAFTATAITAPWIQWLLLQHGPFGVALPEWMALPKSATFDRFPSLSSVAWLLIVVSPLTVLFMELLGGYRQIITQSRVRVLISSVLSPLLALSFLTLTFFALKTSSSSRVMIFAFALLSVIGLLTYRGVLRAYKRHRLASGAYAKSIVLLGRPSAIRWMVEHFRKNVPTNRYRLTGWLSVGEPTESDAISLTWLGSVENLGELLVHCPIHEVIAVQSFVDRDWLRKVIENCDYFRVTVRIVPEALLVDSLRDLKLMFRTEPLRLPEVLLEPKYFESDALFLKRVFDIIFSAVLLLLLAPLLGLIALAIKLTTPRLPVFYPWHVVGLKGRRFTGYKFTTMVADADERKQDLMDRNEMTGPVFKIKDDPRITTLGRLLRKYSLNELPQLWSVLRGDMSLVGPRPAGPLELERYELWHKRKLCVQPGITCLWQVSGRNRINYFDDWVRLDLEYIDNWSIWLDCRILIRTAWAVVSGSGS